MSKILTAALAASTLAWCATASAQSCAEHRNQTARYAASIKCEDLIPGWCAKIRREYVESTTSLCVGMGVVINSPPPVFEVRIVR